MEILNKISFSGVDVGDLVIFFSLHLSLSIGLKFVCKLK